jgi:hypothetical protein
MPIGSTLLRALALGALLSTAVFLLILHPRPDISWAIGTAPFEFKLLVVVCVTVASTPSLASAALPVPAAKRQRLLLLGPLLLSAGVIVELITAPEDSWAQRWLGHNATHCLSLVPLLSAPALACLLFALRQAAPAYPTQAGAAAGLVAGGIGAVLYALTCPDDSPLFVATWYSIAIGAVTGISALVGKRWLQW